MKITYGQIYDALLKVYQQEFDRKTGKQELARFDSAAEVPMEYMMRLLYGVGDAKTVEIERD